MNWKTKKRSKSMELEQYFDGINAETLAQISNSTNGIIQAFVSVKQQARSIETGSSWYS